MALTANALPADREACLAAGMDDFLPKPFEMNALEGLLNRWLAHPGDLPEVPPAAAPEGTPHLSSASAAPVNAATLADLREVLREDYAGFLEAYRSSAGEILDGMSQAREPAELERLAHSLKSASATLGAQELAALCQALENQSRERREAGLAALSARVRQETRRVLQWLGEA